ncbi:hypothetical protein F5888DRAFT_1744938, partial [Russula emetica]
MSLYQEDDHQRLTTDSTIYTPSSNGRLFGFLPYRTGIAPAFRHDAIIVPIHRHLLGPRRRSNTNNSWPSSSRALSGCRRQLGH